MLKLGFQPRQNNVGTSVTLNRNWVQPKYGYLLIFLACVPDYKSSTFVSKKFKPSRGIRKKMKVTPPSRDNRLTVQTHSSYNTDWLGCSEHCVTLDRLPNLSGPLSQRSEDDTVLQAL